MTWLLCSSILGPNIAYAFTNIMNTFISPKTRWKNPLIKLLPKIKDPIIASDYNSLSLLPVFDS